ncbi:DUF3099 domain-containing protein [Corynebacterium hansenii]|uniref:DUF3099 domain-containing protein n=1 Tax=Corynebacterium hansenii TaxID=394964 RepID=A0ABV7ZUA9_9CORY|nr:DUF3099 domain-containing protein [Corynebacterium hansenii]WJY99852.1 hypothetical protein CHAN_06165 [Corynebacterium hansenii]
MASRRTNHRGRRGSDAVLITDARQSRIRNYNYRRHTYAVLQWSRIPLLLLAAAAFMWWDLPWLAAIVTVVSVPMPWIAVVIANGVGEPADKRSPRVYKPGVIREQNRRWEEAQRERLARLADGPSAALEGPAEGGPAANLPAVPGDADAPGPWAGFDPSMVIDMDDDGADKSEADEAAAEETAAGDADDAAPDSAGATDPGTDRRENPRT